MGASFSNQYLKNKLEKHFSNETTNELLSYYRTVMSGINKLEFKNIYRLSVKGNFRTVIANQNFADHVLKVARESSVEEDVTQDVVNEQMTKGIGAISASNMTLYNELCTYVDSKVLNRDISQIYQSFNIGNMISVVNDEILPGSSVDIDVNMIAESTNTQVQNTLNDYLENLDFETQEKIKNKNKQSTTGIDIAAIFSSMVLPLALCIGGLIVYKQMKNK